MRIRHTIPNNNPQRDNARFNEYGGTVGGPIIHNRLFFFFGYDTIRNNGTTIGGGWYDTASLDGESAPPGTIANKFTDASRARALSTKSILEGAQRPSRVRETSGSSRV